MADEKHGKGWGRMGRQRAREDAREEALRQRRDVKRVLADQVRRREVAPAPGEVPPDLQGLPRVGGEW